MLQFINSIPKKTGLILVLFFIFQVPQHLYGQSNAKLDSLVELSNDLINLNDYEEAENKIDEVLDMNKNYAPAIETKVQILVHQNKYSKANRTIRRALDENPEYPAFHLYKAKVLIEKEDYRGAIEHVNKAQGLSKNNDKLLNKIFVTKGAAYQKLQDNEKALINYSKALKINDNNPNVFVYRGYLYYKKDEYKKAIEDFEKVMKLDPNNHYAQYNIGMSEFKLGNKLEACDAFHKACELGNKNACQMVVSKCLRNRGD
jgi:tetratricopeptide (TPR) repeat protein